jgi:hypothetical protein
MLILNVFVFAAVPAQAASTRAIFSYTSYANTPSNNVGLKAILTVQDSNRTIVSITNVELSSTMGGISGNSVSISAPVNKGSEAYVNVSYILNGILMTEQCTWYPL